MTGGWLRWVTPEVGTLTESLEEVMSMRIWISVVAITASLGLASLSAHDGTFVGTVVAMDESKNSLTIKATEGAQEFIVKIGVSTATPVEKERKKVTRADLSPTLRRRGCVG
jgi:hypothetical protein